MTADNLLMAERLNGCTTGFQEWEHLQGIIPLSTPNEKRGDEELEHFKDTWSEVQLFSRLTKSGGQTVGAIVDRGPWRGVDTV
jgi:hypothetical protein